jgi:hypothetical protein
MEKRSAAAVVGTVWLSAVATAAVLSYVVNRPAVIAEGMTTGVATRTEASHLRPTVDEINDSPVLELPTVIIVGDRPAGRRGIAEMQRPDDMVIGPGLVTHP